MISVMRWIVGVSTVRFRLLALPWLVSGSHVPNTSCRWYMKVNDGTAETSRRDDDGHAFLQVQQRMQTPIDAFGEPGFARSLQALQRSAQSPLNETNGTTSISSTVNIATTTNTTTMTTSTTLIPCAPTTTGTTTTTSLGQIHPAEILRSVGSKPLSDAERDLVGLRPLAGDGSELTTTTPTIDSWGAGTLAPPQWNSTTLPIEPRLSPWQVLNAYDKIGPGVNCIMGDWNEWSECRQYEGDGLNQESRVRTREITRGPTRGGNACTATEQQEVCQSMQPETYERNMPSFEED